MLKTIENYGIQTILWAGVAVFAAMVMLPFYAKADSSCGINESRMNPTELSAYQECWLDTHKADETHGVLGSLFWVKVNGDYYSTQIRLLSTTGQREAFLAGIEEDVTATLDAANTVVNESVKIEVIKQIIVDGKEITAEDHIELINELMEANAALTEAQAIVDGMDESIQEAIDEAKDAAWMSFQDNHEANWEAVMEEDNRKADVDGSLKSDKTIDFGAYNRGTHWQLYKVYAGGEYINVLQHGVGAVNIGMVDLLQLDAVMTEVYQVAYDQGYDEGYSAGYADGFEDGVNSVK